jgi:hypothetical protein
VSVEGFRDATPGADDGDGEVGSMSEAVDALRILAGLRAHGVRYVLVGELAASIHGAPLDTGDVDICVPDDEQNLARLSLALQQLVAQHSAATTEDEHRAIFDTPFGRLSCLEDAAEFESLDANATEVTLSHGVATRVAALEDLARLKQGSADLQGAVRLAALVDTADRDAAERLDLPVDADPEPNGRIDRLLEKLAGIDEFITDVNDGKRPLWRKKA